MTSPEKLLPLLTKAGHSLAEQESAPIFRKRVLSWDLKHYAQRIPLSEMPPWLFDSECVPRFTRNSNITLIGGLLGT